MVCESCRFGYIEPNDDGYYCELSDDVIKCCTRCGSWACKLGKIGTPDEFEHNIHRDKNGNWIDEEEKNDGKRS